MPPDSGARLVAWHCARCTATLLEYALDRQALTLRVVCPKCKRRNDYTQHNLNIEPFERLSPRQREVARLAASGMKNTEIARQLVIAVGTAKVHLSEVYAKLGLSGRTQLALLAGREKWLEDTKED